MIKSVLVIKDCLPHILPIITSIISLSLELPIFPRAWEKAGVVPWLREDDHEVPDNNRPISLLAVRSKVAEKLVLQRYTSFLLDRNRLTNASIKFVTRDIIPLRPSAFWSQITFSMLLTNRKLQPWYLLI